MHVHKSDLALLQVFDSIYREGSLTRAAWSLNLSQPAVSHALARLRQRFADPLFIRQGVQMQPTARARQIALPVSQALQQLRQVLELPEPFDPGHRQLEFRLGLRDVLEAMLLPPLLQRLGPGLRISSMRCERQDMEDELARGSLDLVIDVLRPSVGSLRQAPLLQESLVVLMRRGHPLAQELDLDTYLQAGHVLVSSRRQGLSLEDVELARQGRQRRIVLRCQHYYAASAVVASSDLLLTMPEHYARRLEHDHGNCVRPLPLAQPGLSMHMYWHMRRDEEAAHRWLREQLKLLSSSSQLGLRPFGSLTAGST